MTSDIYLNDDLDSLSYIQNTGELASNILNLNSPEEINNDDQTSLKKRFLFFVNRIHSNKTIMTYIFMLLVIVVGTSDWIFWKKLITSFSSSKGTFLIFAVQFYALFLSATAGILLITSKVTNTWKPEMASPVLSFVPLGSVESLAFICSALGASGTLGITQQILSQLILPAIMVMSIFMLGMRYSKTQYGGAGIIILGACVVVIPSLISGPAPGDTATNTPWGIALFTFCDIPLALALILKEKLFKINPLLNPHFLICCNYLFQFFLFFFALPILSLPLFGNLSVAQYHTQYTDGIRCFLGLNVDGFNCDGRALPPGVFLILYCISNFMTQTLKLLLMQVSNSTIVQITNSVTLVVSNVAFCLPFFMGEDVEEINAFTLISLIVVIGGFSIYQFLGDRSDKISSDNFQVSMDTLETSSSQERDMIPQDLMSSTSKIDSIIGDIGSLSVLGGAGAGVSSYFRSSSFIIENDSRIRTYSCDSFSTSDYSTTYVDGKQGKVLRISPKMNESDCMGIDGSISGIGIAAAPRLYHFEDDSEI